MVKANLNLKSKNNIAPIRYGAVKECLSKIVVQANNLEASIHMPRIGCGLAGGKWEEIEPIINQTLLRENLEVFVYDFK